MGSLKDRLSDILLKNNLLTQEQLNQALAVQKTKGGRLSEIIVELKLVKDSDLMLALSEGLDFPVLDLKRYKIFPDLAKIIPSTIARRYVLIPLSRLGDWLTVAMSDPLNIFAIDHVESVTGLKVTPVLASSQDIMMAIETAYSESAKDAIGDLVKEMSDASIELVREEKDLTEAELGQEAPVIKLTDLILENGVKKKASDILIEPFEKTLRIRYRLDGILHEEKAPPRKLHQSIVTRIKVMSELNIAEHRLPQDGRFKARVQGKEVDFRVSILPTSFGEKVAIRILDKSTAMLDIMKLGFGKHTVDTLQKVSKMPHGMILVCGPTGSGKTTTLYSVLKFVDSPEKNIVTVEDPVEYQIEGINQVTARPDIGLTFAAALRSILRQDPNVIMIGEIRDLDTVDIAIKSALTGHLVLSTLHTNTACGSILRLVNMGVEPFMLNSALICVVAQRLLRKLCQYCAEEYYLTDEAVESMHLKLPPSPEGKHKFYRAKGCQRCMNTGYSGRVGIAEVLVLTPKVRELILNRAEEHFIKAQARSEGMNTLREDGMRAVLAGFTTLEEVLRITAPDE
ncbi:MAG: GspE/PulE family protein [Deltaproteobacteria bacterium]